MVYLNADPHYDIKDQISRSGANTAIKNLLFYCVLVSFLKCLELLIYANYLLFLA